jgi:hypothetical protein
LVLLRRLFLLTAGFIVIFFTGIVKLLILLVPLVIMSGIIIFRGLFIFL